MDDNALLTALKQTRKDSNAKAKRNDVGATDSSDSHSSGNSISVDPNQIHNGIQRIAFEPIIQHKMPAIEPVKVAGPVHLTPKQKSNISLIAFALETHFNEPIEAPRIYELWPVKKNTDNELKLNQAGPRPSITGITQFIGTEEYARKMEERGIIVSVGPAGLLPEQVALISILTDTSSKAALGSRLKRAGIAWPVYTAWRRQKVFAEALSAAAGGALTDAIENSDVQLAQLAQGGDLNAIKYLNEMLGRGPDDKKAVDAMQFAKLILEAVQRNVNSEQARAIAAEVGLLAKQIGL